MENILLTLKKIIPKEIEVLERRYTILKGIQSYQPIGRRSLSQKLTISEKIVRNDTEYLKAEGYILVSASGMLIEDAGCRLLDELELTMHYFKGLSILQEEVRRFLDCEKVIVVPGNVDSNGFVKENIGKAASEVLINTISDNDIIALTGGSTAYHVVNSLKKINHNFENVFVVPARGSLRNNVEFQANTIASTLAKKIGATYKLLNIPDNLSRKSLDSVRQEPEISETLAYILKANIILFGIGNAFKMAYRRKTSETVIDFLKRKQAIAEALGYYFDKNGQIVYTSRSIGIKLEHMTKLAYPIAVAGGASKAEAIIAVKKVIKKGCLVIDEGAAHKIIEICNKESFE